MTEKYKIYIPEDTKNRLMNDAELFEFRKKDDSINLNAFLKTLLINYFEPYQKQKDRLLHTILSDLESFPSISGADASAIAKKIVNNYMKTENMADRRTSITLTVSGRSLEIMTAIENNFLIDISMSQYIYDLFQSYLSIARNERERIIFRDTFEELNHAIKYNRVISFSSTSVPDLVFTINPYLIATSKEEQCNYLLGADHVQGKLRTFRISRLKGLYTTSDTYKTDNTVMETLQEIARRNPQSASQSVEAEVHLSKRGELLFQLIVKNRPEVLRKDGNKYFFFWPKRQLEDYFKRFGYDAVIVSPDDCHNRMIAFYGRSEDTYRRNRL